MDDANAGQRQPQAPDCSIARRTTTRIGFDMFGGGGPEWACEPALRRGRALKHPFVRQFMEQAMQDPELLRPMMQMMEQNPQIQQLMNANPELRQAMQDPETISRALRASRDPNLMREQMAANDRTFANIESHPEGFNALRRMYENVEVPMQNAIQNSQNSDSPADAAANPFASLFGSTSSSSVNNSNAAKAARRYRTLANECGNRQPTPQPNAKLFAGLGGMAAAAGFANPASQMEMIQNNPALMQVFSRTMSQIASDPNALDNLRRSNPEFDAMLRQQPQLAEQMRNPEFLRALADPQTLQAMSHLQRVMGGAGGGLGGGGLGGSPFGGMGAPAVAASRSRNSDLRELQLNIWVSSIQRKMKLSGDERKRQRGY